MIFDHEMIASLYYLGYNNAESAQFIQKVVDTIENVETQQNADSAIVGGEQ